MKKIVLSNYSILELKSKTKQVLIIENEKLYNEMKKKSNHNNFKKENLKLQYKWIHNLIFITITFEFLYV